MAAENVRVSGSSVQELPLLLDGYDAGSVLSLQNKLTWLSKELVVCPMLILLPGGSTTKNLYV